MGLNLKYGQKHPWSKIDYDNAQDPDWDEHVFNEGEWVRVEIDEYDDFDNVMLSAMESVNYIGQIVDESDQMSEETMYKVEFEEHNISGWFIASNVFRPDVIT